MNKTNTTKLRYFLYARKSSEGEDRQVRSIEDQLSECYDLANSDKLNIVGEFRESMTAKKPGRPVFNEMLQRIEDGEADAILAWEPNRLARNMLDGGRVSHLLGTGTLKHLSFVNYFFVNNSHGIHALNQEFAHSTFYSHNLGENVKRGIRRKIERGEFPFGRKYGYYCHPKTKVMLPDPKTFPFVQKLFELCLTDNYSLMELSKQMHKLGMVNGSGKPVPKSQIVMMLSDPFYYGAFLWLKELHEGIHKPVVSKADWDKVQAILKRRSRPRTKNQQKFAYTGLLQCAECGMSVTATHKTKHMKSGKVHDWTYYHCTKKSRNHKCQQPFVREEELTAQFMDMLSQVALPDDWVIPMLEQIGKWEVEEEDRAEKLRAHLALDLKKIEAKLRRLTDLYLEEDIDRAEYTARKEGLVNEKIALMERKRELSRQGAKLWLEPLRDCVNTVWEKNLPTGGGDLFELRQIVAKVGLNQTLDSRILLWDWIQPYALIASRGSSQEWWAILDSNQ